MRILLFVILTFAVAAVMACGLVWMIRWPGPVSSVVGPLVAAGGLLGLLALAFRMLWRPPLAGFPPVEPKPDAVRRRHQSFSLGFVNMGLSIHVAADEDHLHLTPLPVLQWLGARPASIPWSAMTPVGTSGRVVRVNGHRLEGPKWCMELASVGRGL